MWGQGVAVENRAGASGNIGTEAVVHAAPDGYTLLLQNSTMVVNQAVAGKLNYDPEKDLTPIMLLGVTPIALVAHPSLGVKNLKDLVAYSKAHPKTLAYGSCGIGTPQHFVMELVKQKTGIDATHAGYKGCAPGLTDVVGGQIPLAILSANLVAPYVASGKLVAIGVSTKDRYKLLPDTPTFEEQGLKPLDFSIWYALMGPAKLPPEVVARIHGDVLKILAQPDTQAKLSSAGVEPLKGDAGQLEELIREDAVRYRQLAKSANIKAE
jgi:tripartite-type tricarboxylate transporter receptor subunit TctC